MVAVTPIHSGKTVKPTKTPTVCLYCGRGAGDRSVMSAGHALQATLRGMQVVKLDMERLLQGGWQDSCKLFVMPGGADLPYCEDLNGRGNQLIHDFVEAGGAFLGLCAGAYYACRKVEFELGTELEVEGDRELSFFPGTARGCVFPGFCYRSEAGTHAARLTFRPHKLASLVSDVAKVGRNDSESALQDDRGSQAGFGAAVSTSKTRDYSSGGPAFLLDTGSSIEDTCVLATYDDHGDLPAAVRCCVGKGLAVLVGTHPELHPDWLRGSSSEGAGQESECRRVESVRLALLEDAQQRTLFWRSLLCEAGLAEFLRTPDP